MAEAVTAPRKRPVPWTGRRKVADLKNKPSPIRFTQRQFEQLFAAGRRSA